MVITSHCSRTPGEERGGKRGRKQGERARAKAEEGGLSRIAIRGWIERVRKRGQERARWKGDCNI